MLLFLLFAVIFFPLDSIMLKDLIGIADKRQYKFIRQKISVVDIIIKEIDNCGITVDINKTKVFLPVRIKQRLSFFNQNID